MAGEFKDVRVFWATTSAGQFALALVLFVENLDQIGNEDGLESLHANGTRHRCQSLFPHELQKKKKKKHAKSTCGAFFAHVVPPAPCVVAGPGW